LSLWKKYSFETTKLTTALRTILGIANVRKCTVAKSKKVVSMNIKNIDTKSVKIETDNNVLLITVSLP